MAADPLDPTLLRRQNRQQLLSDILGNARGLAQIGTKLGGDLLGTIAGGVNALGYGALTGDLGGAAERVQRGKDALAYEPTSQEAKDYTRSAQGALVSALRGGQKAWSAVPGSEAINRAGGQAFGRAQGAWDKVVETSPELATLGVIGINAADLATGGGKSKVARSLRKAAMDVDVPDDEFLALLQQNMTPRDRAALRQGDTQAIRDLYYEASGLSPEIIAPAAIAGRAKKGWYKNSGQALRDVFGNDTEQFVALLAATSPRTSVQNNLQTSLNMWRDWNAAGRPTDPSIIDQLLEGAVARSEFADADKSSVLDAWRNNVVRALSDPASELDDAQAFLSGPKVESFRRNLLGQAEEVTNDAWQATATGVDQKKFGGRGMSAAEKRARGVGAKEGFGVPGPGYLGTSAVVRETAKRLEQLTGEKWTPAEVQETLWSLTKAAWEKADTTNAPIGEVIRTLQHNEVADVPDFSGLLTEGKYGDVLQSAGYGKQLDQLRQRYAPQVTPGTPADIRIEGGVDPFVRHLQGQYLQRRLPGELREVRTRLSGGASDVGGRLYEGRSGEVGGYDLDPRLRANVKQTLAPNDALIAALRRHDISAPKLLELAQTPEAANYFREQILRTKESLGPEGAAVHVYEPEEYAKMRLLMPETGKGAGFALKPTEQGSDIVSLFNRGSVSGQRGFAFPAVLAALQQGGNTLDAFDTVLPNLYSIAGMRESARLPFNPKFAPEGWDEQAMRRFNLGQPDVMYMHAPLWEADRFGRMTPPETLITPIAPRRYGKDSRREALLARTPAGAEQKQKRALAGTAAQRDMIAFAQDRGGRVPTGRAYAKALREWKAKQKTE